MKIVNTPPRQVYSLHLFSLIFALAIVVNACNKIDNTEPYSEEIEDPSGLDELKELSIPVLWIETESGEEPSCEYVSPPEGCVGNGITNALKLDANLFVTSSKDTIFRSDQIFESIKPTIKVRGNTSAYSPKKGYKIKLPEKYSLLDVVSKNCPESEGLKSINADKNWVLIKNDFGQPFICNAVGNVVASSVGMDFVPEYLFVNVVINGNYKGLYYLSESIERSNARVNISKNGAILEYDPYWWNEEYYLPCSMSENGRYRYTLKFPDPEDLSKEQESMLIEKLELLEECVTNGNYEEYLDMESSVKFVLAHDILAIADNAGTGKYLALDNSTSKFVMPCLWDFDTLTGNDGFWGGVHYVFFYNALFHSSNDRFKRAYIKKYDDVIDKVIDDVMIFLDSFKHSTISADLQLSLDKEKEIYNVELQDVDDVINFMMKWFPQRKIWLSQNIDEMKKSW